MNIKKARIKQFYSIVDISFNLDEYKGLVNIIGINKDHGGSNGSGKSALFEAIVWGLFGRTIRKSTEAALCNNRSVKGCSVVLDIEKDYTLKIRIERSRKPSKLKLFLNDLEVTKESSRHTQIYIEQLLNISYKTFLSSTIFGQHNKIRFLDSSIDEKREIIRRFLDLEYIFSMRDKIKKEKQRSRDQVLKETTLFNEYCTQIEKIDSKLERIKKSNFSEISENLDILSDQKITIDKLLSQLNILVVEERKLGENITEIDKKLSNAPKESVSVCFTCGSTISKKLNLELLESTSINLKMDVEYKLKAISRIQKKLDGYPSNIDSLIQLKKLENDNKEKYYQETRKELVVSINLHLASKTIAQKQLDLASFWDKAFSEKGLVKYIIRNILNYLNNSVNYYLSYLTNSSFSLEFDDELTEIITHNDKIIHYISLSGGEKRKINLAVMLGLQRIVFLTSKEKCNFILFDEVAENIDPTGLEGLAKLFHDLKKDRTVFVITHNKELEALLNTSNSITIVKEKDISVIR